MAGGGEVPPPRETAMEEMDRQPVVPFEAAILRMEIASLVNLLSSELQQSDLLPYDPELVRKITSLKSDIERQKLARQRKSQVTEGCDCDQKEIESEINNSTSGFKPNIEHACLPYGGEGARLNCQFSSILQQTDALCDEMVDLTVDKGQSSAETHESRVLNKGKSIASTETHASRMMDEGKSSTGAIMGLDSNEKGELEPEGMTDLWKYYEMLEYEDEEALGEMTPENLRVYNKFCKEIQELEAVCDQVQEQNDKDDLRWEQVKKDALSCCRTNPTPFSLQDEVGETVEEEEIEFTKSDTEEMEMEDRVFDLNRKGWESRWGDDCGEFEDRTLLSPMHFTHCTPGLIPYAAGCESTLQIYSLKIVGTFERLKLPLHVYGVVAARDAVDYNRNIIFARRRVDCQKLTREDPFLHLIGPSRAIVAVDDVEFEIQLKVKGATRSGDRALISRCFTYSGRYHKGLDTGFLSNGFCTVELSLERLTKTVQATILSVCVLEGGPWPFEYGGRIMCSSPPQEVTDSLARQVVLVDSHHSHDLEMPMGSHGYLDLSRHVVSVELGDSLQFVIQAYSQSGDAIARQGCLKFRTNYCNVSRGICEIGDSEVEITVAWSQLVTRKRHILLEGHV